MKAWPILVLAAATACSVPADGPTFVGNVAYDTVAKVGQASETNPLLVYRAPIGLQLIKESTVLYADNTGGNLTAVNMISGQGWQVLDGGLEGPGEFGGGVPWFSESNGLVFTAGMTGQASTRSLDGELLSSRQYREFIYDDDTQFPVWPKGLLAGGVIVTYFSESPDPSTWEEQELIQGLKAYSPDDGLLWSYTAFPPLVIRLNAGPGSSVSASVISGQGAVADARHGTVVVGMDGQSWLATLNADGTQRARTELPYDLFNAFIDGDERVWAQVWAKNEQKAGSWIVLDRDLNTIAHAAERDVQDARGDYLLTIDLDDLGLIHMYLLKRRPTS